MTQCPSQNTSLDTRAANLNSNSLELDRFCRTRTRKIKFFQLELEKKQSSSSSLIECFKFIDSNLSKRTLLEKQNNKSLKKVVKFAHMVQRARSGSKKFWWGGDEILN